MKRGIMLMGNPGNSNNKEEYCAGVLDDLSAYKNFFMSNKGGAWEENEIRTLLYPTKKDVFDNLEWLGSLNYSIIVFSGHGYSEDRETILVLSEADGDIISEYDLVRKKRTVILDCCRKSIDIECKEKIRKGYVDLIESWGAFDRTLARFKYDKAIEACGEDAIVLYGCSLGEYSGDIEGVGGIYSSELLRTAEN